MLGGVCACAMLDTISKMKAAGGLLSRLAPPKSNMEPKQCVWKMISLVDLAMLGLASMLN